MPQRFRSLIVALLIALLTGCGVPRQVATAQPEAPSAPVATLDIATPPPEATTATVDATSSQPSAAETMTSAAPANANDIILATTTSTQDSGLLDVLIPRFEEQTNYTVKTIAVGSGAALALGQRGEADVVLAHAPTNERELVASGAGIDRSLVMYNDFILVGPADDPAGLKGTTEIVPAMQKLATSGSSFVSRGDKSGTNQLELKLWKTAAVTPQGKPWYIESGSGMGQTLQIAYQRGAYTITDRATYLAWRDRIFLQIVLEDDPALINMYHVIAINPVKFSRVNGAGARAFIDFLLDTDTQTLIGQFGRDTYNQALFTPCAQNSCGLANGGD